MTRTATGLQAAPVAACLLLVAGAGLGSLGGYEFAARHAAGIGGNPASPETRTGTREQGATHVSVAAPIASNEIASVSGIVRQPDSNLVRVSYNQVEPRLVEGTLDDPQIRQLLMVASQNGADPDGRDNSVELLAKECRSGQ